MPKRKRKVRSDKGKKRAVYSIGFMKKVERGFHNFLRSPFQDIGHLRLKLQLSVINKADGTPALP